MGVVTLLPGREKSVLNRHPWVYSGAVAGVRGAEPGSIVDVETRQGVWLARGFYNPSSEISVRLFSWDREEAPCEEFWRNRMETAFTGRGRLCSCSPDGSACRLSHAEADGLPGLIVDRYGGFLVMQFLVAGMDRMRDLAVSLAVELTGAQGVWERSDTDARRLEGLEPRSGHLAGDEPPGLLEIAESGARFLVDVRHGHKTGFYLDQAENRLSVRAFAAGRSVLDCFCYSGGFGVSAAVGGASSVRCVDSSGPALQRARMNFALNGFEGDAFDFVDGDVPTVLREMRGRGEEFGLVVVDPPRFVASRSNLQRGSRAYKDVNMVAMQVLEPGGILATYSCSGNLDRDLFQKILFSAALDSGRTMQVIRTSGQPPDHPVLLSYPQSGYLNGFILRDAGSARSRPDPDGARDRGTRR